MPVNSASLELGMGRWRWERSTGTNETSAITMILVVLASVAYYGLAIAGWGGFAGSFSYPPLVVLAIVIFVMLGVVPSRGGAI